MVEQGIKIHAADATIRTTEVSIRCLVIGKKQLTLSIFRQIPSSPVLDPEGQARGKLWGRVNYAWKGCDQGKPGHGHHPDHYHVVWQNGGRLMRDCVRQRDYTKLGYRGGDMTLETAAFRLLILKRLADEPYPEHPEWDNGVILQLQGLQIGFTPADFRECYPINSLKLYDWRDGMPLRRVDRETLQQIAIKQSTEEARVIAAYRKVSRNKTFTDAFNKNAARTKMEIEALDQLFIAV